MAYNYGKIPKDEFETWLTPMEALAELAPMEPETASIHIQTALRASLIVSAAETVSIQPKNGVAEIEGSFAHIPSFYWNHVSEQANSNGFWEGGLARFWLAAAAGFANPMACVCFNVRFKPEEIRKLKPKPPRQSASAPDWKPLEPPPADPRTGGEPTPPPASISEAPAKPDTRKAVPEPALDRWAKVFVGVHADFKGEFALRSAQAMFPDNTVSRDRVVAALAKHTGPRKRGPKKTIS